MITSSRSSSFIVSLLLFILSFATARAQFLPLNTSGKCGLEEVVVAEGQTRAILYANEKEWFQSILSADTKFTALVKDSLEGKINADAETLLYSQSGILRKLAGSATYHISVEIKDGKYRYNFSSFVYHYYAQNRNYVMAKTGKTKPFEETNASGWQKLWTQHRKTIGSLATNQVKSLKVKMAEVPQAATTTKAEEKKVEW